MASFELEGVEFDHTKYGMWLNQVSLLEELRATKPPSITSFYQTMRCVLCLPTDTIPEATPFV